MSYHDPFQHLENLRYALSNDKKPIGFFIAAGCPLSIKSSKNNEEAQPLIPDIESLTKQINDELTKKESKYITLLSEIKKAELNCSNIENILTFIRDLKQVSHGCDDVRGFKESELITFEEKVCEKISEKLNVRLPDQETPYHNLSTWINSIDRAIPIEIFTTNYDLLLEEALEDISVPYFDGFVGSRKPFFDLKAIEENLIPLHWTRLWKIHGSINWFQTEEKGEKYVYRSTDVRKEEPKIIYPSHLKYEQSRKMPYLALIDQLNRFIRKKSSILIISGYSFRDEHLNNTIVNALKANPTAMLLALMFGKYHNDDNNNVERYPLAYKLAKKRHNLSIWTVDKAIIGTTPGNWKIFKESEDVSLSKFVVTNDCRDSSKKNEVSKEINVNIVNFAFFTEFLKSLIGGVENSTDNENSTDDE